jgi:hypothetical protein
MENSMEALKKLEIEWPCNPAMPLLEIHLEECKSGYNKDTCTPMFIAALFTISHGNSQDA